MNWIVKGTLLFASVLYLGACADSQSGKAEKSTLQNQSAVSEISKEKEAKKQGQLISQLEGEMKVQGLVYNNLEKVGNFYFDGEQIIFLIDKENEDKESLKKMHNLVAVLEEQSPDDFDVKPVKYSYRELVESQDNISAFIESTDAKVHYKLEMNTPVNRLNLTISSLSIDNEQYLMNKYEDLLTIKVDPSYKIGPVEE